MTELKVISEIGEKTREKEFLKMLNSMRELIQPHFKNPLKVGFVEHNKEGDPFYPACNSFFYIAEEARRSRFLRRKRYVLAVDPTFMGEAYGDKAIEGFLFKPEIEKVVIEELKKWGKPFGLTEIKLTVEHV